MNKYLFHMESNVYFLFLDVIKRPSSEENTHRNIFQQSTTLTAKMWYPVSFV